MYITWSWNTAISITMKSMSTDMSFSQGKPSFSETKYEFCLFAMRIFTDRKWYRGMSHILKELQTHKKLLDEDEWRKLGVVQSRGWEHYEYH